MTTNKRPATKHTSPTKSDLTDQFPLGIEFNGVRWSYECNSKTVQPPDIAKNGNNDRKGNGNTNA